MGWFFYLRMTDSPFSSLPARERGLCAAAQHQPNIPPTGSGICGRLGYTAPAIWMSSFGLRVFHDLLGVFRWLMLPFEFQMSF